MTCMNDGIKRVEGARRFCQEYVGPTHVTLYVTERCIEFGRQTGEMAVDKEIINHLGYKGSGYVCI
jgi:hypothetical protein